MRAPPAVIGSEAGFVANRRIGTFFDRARPSGVGAGWAQVAHSAA